MASERAVEDPAGSATATFRELAQLVERLGDELSAFRRRALQAEAELRQLREELDQRRPVVEDQGPRIEELERENAVLRARVQAASDRTRQMLDRVRFLRQQVSG